MAARSRNVARRFACTVIAAALSENISQHALSLGARRAAWRRSLASKRGAQPCASEQHFQPSSRNAP